MLFTQKEVVRQLSIPFYRLEYLHKTGQVPEVAKTSSGVRVYTRQDIDRIRKILLLEAKYK